MTLSADHISPGAVGSRVRARRPDRWTTALGRLDDPRLEQAWRGLQEAGHVPSPFLSWEWASALRDVPGVAGGIEVLTVAEDDRIVGLLPVERVRSATGATVVGIAGQSWLAPDHTDVIAAPEHRGPVATALLRLLARSSGWDVLQFDALQRTARSRPPWPRRSGFRGTSGGQPSWCPSATCRCVVPS
ncbi:hypothetical protein [Pseudonocardia nigra]|uniref:hypothetical protein n=1 Tax=Pseudonocardia nigra TaxID=1921578 RepID=UPI001C5DAFC9|nr:hypothetical protein [Pseudonocardia nigra]